VKDVDAVFGVAWDRWLILIMVALFVLGPDRLPAAAQEKLHAEIGPELAELGKPLEDLPLAELRRLRNPRAALVEFLFAEHAPPTAADQPVGSAALSPDARRGGAGLVAGERPPTDPDAT